MYMDKTEVSDIIGNILEHAKAFLCMILSFCDSDFFLITFQDISVFNHQ